MDDNQNQGGMPTQTPPAQPEMPAGDQGGMPTPPAAPEVPAEGGEETPAPTGDGDTGMGGTTPPAQPGM